MRSAYSVLAPALVLGVLLLPGIALADDGANANSGIRWLLMAVCAAPVLYFVPAVIAASLDHPRASEIFLLNLLAGWTVIGWFGALVWALMGEGKPLVRRGLHMLKPALRFTPEMAAQEIEDLLIMKGKGLITEDEYAIGKKLILDRWAMTSGQAPLMAKAAHA